MSFGSRYRYPDLKASVARRCPAGHPLVLRCHPLRIREGHPLPFPTIYWLDCKFVQRAISGLEHQGVITRLQDRIRDDATIREGVLRDHAEYVTEREAMLLPSERELIERHGLLNEFRSRGIGGIRSLTSIKCLHLHYAHHLVRGSTIGRMIDELAPVPLCAAVEAVP